MTQFDASAWGSIQALFDDPACDTLSARIDEILDLLDSGATDHRVRRHRTSDPVLWMVPVYGSGIDWVILWRADPESNEPYVVYAGPSPINQ